MSDCFDHAADAYDDLCFGRTSDEGAGGENIPFGEYHFFRQQSYRGKSCKFCGTPHLFWHQIDGKWKLCKNGKPHDCDHSLEIQK